MRSFRHVLVGNLFAWKHLSVLPEELEEIGDGRGWMGGWAVTTGVQF